jgi:hypothetical protein
MTESSIQSFVWERQKHYLEDNLHMPVEFALQPPGDGNSFKTNNNGDDMSPLAV